MPNMLTAISKRRMHRVLPNRPVTLSRSRRWESSVGSLEVRSMTQLATSQCARAVSLFRGLYARVARSLEVDVSYVSRVARGERKSKVAEKALTREFNKAVVAMSNGLPRFTKRPYIVVTRCPRCKTQRKVHVVARPGFGKMSGERI